MMDAKVSKGKNITRWVIERTLPMLDEIESKTVQKYNKADQ